jgi:hypothetical protein
MSARHASAILFAVVYAIVYLVSVEKNYALFTYHPALVELDWGVQKAREGPAMYWYGWMATAGIAAAVAAGLGLLLPPSLARRVVPSLAWIVPLAVILFFSYLLRNFFLR